MLAELAATIGDDDAPRVIALGDFNAATTDPALLPLSAELTRALLDARPDALDVHIERLGVTEVVTPPHAVDELTAREHTPRVAHEHLKKLELLQRHVDDLAVHGDGVTVDVEGDAASLQHALIDLVIRLHDAAQHSAHPRQQLTRRVRLGDVVIRAELETDDDVDLGVLRSEHDDRHVRGGADLAAHLGPGNAREHEVEQHDIRAVVTEGGDRGRPVLCDLDVVAFSAQQVGERIGEVGFVFDEEDARHS